MHSQYMSSGYLGKIPTDLLWSVGFHCMEYHFGHIGSALPVVSLPKSCATPGYSLTDMSRKEGTP